MRYTRKDAEVAFKRLARILGKSTQTITEDRKFNIGAWELDYNGIYGGAIVEEISNENGAIFHPLGEGRQKPADFCRTTHAIEELIRNGYLSVIEK